MARCKQLENMSAHQISGLLVAKGSGCTLKNEKNIQKTQKHYYWWLIILIECEYVSGVFIMYSYINLIYNKSTFI